MIDSVPPPWQLYPMPPEQEAKIQQYIDGRMERAKKEGFLAGRQQAAEDIRARLAEDIAEGDDVSSGHAIWEQHGWREGLKLAADIAEEGLMP